MEVPHINGDSYPQGLKKALGIIKSSAKQFRRKMRTKFPRGCIRAPRQTCKVCAEMFDFAMVDPNTPVAVSLCSKCKDLLSQGYAAFVCLKPSMYSFAKSQVFDAKGWSGKINQVDEGFMKVLKAKFEGKTSLDESKDESSGQA